MRIPDGKIPIPPHGSDSAIKYGCCCTREAINGGCKLHYGTRLPYLMPWEIETAENPKEY